MASATVVIADDQPLVREGLRAVLADVDDVETVGEASDGQGAVLETRARRPDVLVLDLDISGLRGRDVIRRITAVSPTTAVLVLAPGVDPATVSEVVAAGARGFLLKRSPRRDLLQAIRAVAAGHAIFGREVVPQVLAQISRDPSVGAGDPFPQLNRREAQILDLLAAGHRTAAIAQALFLSPKTVSNHLTAVYAKLDVPDRAAAIIRARESGLGRGGYPSQPRLHLVGTRSLGSGRAEPDRVLPRHR